MDLNLDTLKHEILEYLETPRFRRLPQQPGRPGRSAHGALGHRALSRLPDVSGSRAARPAAKLILFASREFEAGDIDDLLAQLDDCDLTREERRDYEARLRELRVFEGVTCSLELAFDHDSRLYVYEVQPDWYEEFLELEDEIVARVADEDESDEDDSLGGYFSKN